NVIAAMVGRLIEAEVQQREISEMKTQFLSTMSHEIRTPMNAIHGMFELFGRSELTDRQRTWAEAGLGASHTLQRQVDGILDMARLENNQLSLAPRLTQIHPLIRSWETAARADVLSSSKPISVRLEMDDSVPDQAVLDPERLSQVIFNLTRNAVKFSENGELVIGVSGEPDSLHISVADSGVGIAPEDHQNIFGRFWQVNSGPARLQDGTGLGLSIAQEIMELMGGRIALTSALGRGSTFKVTAPYSEVTP
ncbi:MAG: ATP-binding protein, partial [Pseudomonadota bacterium]